MTRISSVNIHLDFDEPQDVTVLQPFVDFIKDDWEPNGDVTFRAFPEESGEEIPFGEIDGIDFE